MVFSFYFPRVVEVLWWRLERDVLWNFPDHFRGIARSKLTIDRFVPMDYEKHQVVYVLFYEEFLVGEFQSITTQSLYSRIFSKSVWNTYSSY